MAAAGAVDAAADPSVGPAVVGAVAAADAGGLPKRVEAPPTGLEAVEGGAVVAAPAAAAPKRLGVAAVVFGAVVDAEVVVADRSGSRWGGCGTKRLGPGAELLVIAAEVVGAGPNRFDGAGAGAAAAAPAGAAPPNSGFEVPGVAPTADTVNAPGATEAGAGAGAPPNKFGPDEAGALGVLSAGLAPNSDGPPPPRPEAGFAPNRDGALEALAAGWPAGVGAAEEVAPPRLNPPGLFPVLEAKRLPALLALPGGGAPAGVVDPNSKLGFAGVVA